MADKLKIPKGRTTIRKSGSLTGLHGQRSRAIRLWPFDAKPNTTFARLETAYMSGLNAVDQIEEHTRSTTASGRFTPQGVKDDALKFALSDLIPSLHRARTTIKKAKGRWQSGNRNFISKCTIRQTLLLHFGEWKFAPFFGR